MDYLSVEEQLAQALRPLSTATKPLRKKKKKPEEDEKDVEPSVLKKIGRAGLSGLQAVGNVLDTPGAFVRDLISGKNPLPGIFDPEKRTSGKELTGIEDKPGLWDDVGGFLAEVATDPLTYMTLGGAAVGKGMKLLQKASLADTARLAKVHKAAGLTPTGKRLTAMELDLDTFVRFAEPEDVAKLTEKAGGKDALDELLKTKGTEPLRALASVGVPFGPKKLIGTGKTAQKIAEKLDKVGEAVRFSAPVRSLAAVMDYRTRGRPEKEIQKHAADLAREVDSINVDERAFIAKAQTARNAAGYGAEDGDLFRSHLEKIDPQDALDIQKRMDDLAGLGGAATPAVAKAVPPAAVQAVPPPAAVPTPPPQVFPLHEVLKQSDAIQKKIDDLTDDMMAKGKSYEDTQADSVVSQLYDQRIALEEAYTKDLHGRSANAASKLLQKIDPPGKLGGASLSEQEIKSVLEDVYSIRSGGGSFYALAEFSGRKFGKPEQATRELAERLYAEWAKKRNLDKHGLLSGASAILPETQRALGEYFNDLAKKVHASVADEVLSGSQPATKGLSQSVPLLGHSQTAAAVKAAEPDFKSAFDEAYKKADKGQNYVPISDVRKLLPQYTKEQFESGLRQLRLLDQYAADSPHSKAVTKEMRDGGILEGSSNLTWVTRRDEWKPSAQSALPVVAAARPMTAQQREEYLRDVIAVMRGKESPKFTPDQVAVQADAKARMATAADTKSRRKAIAAAESEWQSAKELSASELSSSSRSASAVPPLAVTSAAKAVPPPTSAAPTSAVAPPAPPSPPPNVPFTQAAPQGGGKPLSYPGAINPAGQEIVEDLLRHQDELYQSNQEWGTDPSKLIDPKAEYFHRRSTESLRQKGGSQHRQPLSGEHEAQNARVEELKSIEGGTVMVKRVLQDPEMRTLLEAGGSQQEVVDLLRTKWHGIVPTSSREKLAWMISQWSDETLEAGLFGNDPFFDALRGFTHSREADANANFLTKILQEPNTLKAPTVDSLGAVAARQDGVRLHDLLLKLSIKPGDEGTPGWLAKFAKLTGKSGDELKEMRVREDLAEGLTAFHETFKSPKEVGKWVKALDSVTNIFKAGVLAWPARITRDLLSGQYGNAMAGIWSLNSVRATDSLIRKGVIQDALTYPGVKEELLKRGIANPTAQQATDILKERAYAQGLSGHRLETDMAGQSLEPGTYSAMQAERPGEIPMGFKEATLGPWKKGKRDLNPLHMRGVGDKKHTTMSWFKSFENLGYYSDSMNRLSGWLKQVKEGVDDTAARMKVDAVQVNYKPQTYSATERDVLKRLFPFYSYSSRMLPYTLKQLWEKPGGGIANTIRLGNDLRGDELLPEHIGNTLAIPVGEQEDGSQRYLTGLGLPHEDVLGLFGTAPTALGGAKKFLSNLGGRANPYLKAPVEIMAGKQLYTGRDMQDLDGTLERIISNLGGEADVPILLEQAISSSPLSRVATSVKQATDTRKGLGAKALNLGTGAKLSDVDLAKFGSIATREALEELLRGKEGVRTFEHIFADDELLSPEDRQLMEEYRAWSRAAQKAAKQKKLAKSGQGD